MKRHVAIVVAVTATALAVTLTGCTGTGGTAGGSGNSSAKEIKLAGSFPNASIGDPFWISMECGVTQQAKKLGVEVTMKDAPDSDTGHVAQALDAASLLNADGIVTAGSGSTANNAKIESLQRGGVPVVIVNGPNVPEVAYADVISSSDNSGFAKYVAKDIGAAKGTVGILGGIAGYAVLDQRWKPMAEALKTAAPGITVLDPQYDSFDRTKASSAASALIVAHPDLKAIYAISGPEGAGAAAAVQQAGKAGKVKVYTYDGTPEVIAGIKSGTISAALAQSPYKQGAAAVKLLVQYLKDAKKGAAVVRDKTKDQSLDLKILTKSNIADSASKDYEYRSTCK
jgi:ABC-type sugar transport system substrate-binding protein